MNPRERLQGRDALMSGILAVAVRFAVGTLRSRCGVRVVLGARVLFHLGRI